MNSLTKGIESVIQSAIEEYVGRISSKYSEIKVEDLEKLWNDVSSTMKISVSTEKPHAKAPTKAVAKSESSKEDSNTCPYKNIKGINQDKICGSKTKDGNTYCSRHKKYEGTEQKERKASPMPQNTIKPTKTKSCSPNKSVARVLRKNKTLDKLWHPETSFVFRSNKERIVIGKCVNDKLQPLVEADLDECRKWGFPHAPINDNEDDEDDDDEEIEKKQVVTPPTKEADKKQPVAIPLPTKEAEKKQTIAPHTKEKAIYLVAPSSSASGRKFWECKISGNKYVTRHGKVGKEGSAKEKVYSTHEEAVKEMEKMIKTKKSKSYVEESVPLTKSPAPISNSPKKETPSDIEETLNELQGDSSDQNEDEEEKNEKNLGKNFISNALGLSSKKVASKGDDDEEENMLIEEFDEEDDE